MKGWEDRLRLEKGVRNGGMVEEGEEEEEEEGEEAEEEERRRGWRRLGRRFISHVRRSRLTESNPPERRRIQRDIQKSGSEWRNEGGKGGRRRTAQGEKEGGNKGGVIRRQGMGNGKRPRTRNGKEASNKCVIVGASKERQIKMNVCSYPCFF
mmetsp:Transcript_13566/g.23961  ORF Transcript_13566/g.23961 Transcript_13566/m.23961 type:complete len:153 (-) Transcript_13566:699-1157(-)